LKKHENSQSEKKEEFEIEVLKVEDANDVYECAAYLLKREEYDNVNQVHDDIKKLDITDTLKILSNTLNDILRRGGKQQPYSILLENFHIDKIYRDSYYMHFSSKHFEQSRYCTRLFFLEGTYDDITNISEADLNAKFIGTTIIRPTSVNEFVIGHTLIDPLKLKNCKDSFICKASFVVNMFDKRLNICAFPYMMQDGETITCAETTLLNILEYFGTEYSGYKSAVPSDINKLSQENSFQRTLPTEGLTYTAVSKILTEYNFFPRLYGHTKEPKMILEKLCITM